MSSLFSYWKYSTGLARNAAFTTVYVRFDTAWKKRAESKQALYNKVYFELTMHRAIYYPLLIKMFMLVHNVSCLHY